MNKLNYGLWTVLDEVEPLKNKQNKNVRIMKCVCECGKVGFPRLSDLKSGKSTRCKDKIHKISHGMSYSKEYSAWSHMKNRCNDPNNSQYCDYGGRGIKVCQEWLNSFETFYKDMGKCTENKSLERKDNSKGYNKENCEWADKSRQQYNQRKKKTNTSGRTGVGIDRRKRFKKFYARIEVNGVVYSKGYFNTFEEALAAVEQLELEYRGFIRKSNVN